MNQPQEIRPGTLYYAQKTARQLAAEITRALRDKYSVRLPIRGVLEFVPEEQIIKLIERELIEAAR